MSAKKSPQHKKLKAPPGKHPVRLSLCMIARDEEQFIGGCLASARSVADEIIVVDTGSTDRTIEIARQFGARVINFPWIDDFSAARNAGLEHAQGDWILHLDADEELVAEDLPELRQLLNDSDRVAHALTVVSLHGERADGALENAFPSVRLFRNRPQHRFQGVIHEHVTLEDREDSIGISSVRIRHYGYLKPVGTSRQKLARNMRLLEKSAQAKVSDDYQRYIEANEHMTAERYAEALNLYLALYDELDDSDRMNVPKVMLNIICCLKNLGRPDEALAWVDKGLDRFTDYTDLEYLRALTHLEAERYREALESFAACLALGEAPPIYDRQAGVGTWSAWQGIGIAFRGLGRFDVAAAAFRQALVMNPTDALSVAHLGRLLLASGHSWETVERELLKLADGNSPAIKEILRSLAKVKVSHQE